MRTIIGALVFVVMAAACTTDTSTVEDGDVPTVTDASEEVSDDTGAPEEDPSAEPTLQDFVPGVIGFAGDDAEQLIDGKRRAEEEAIARCMAAEGFDYIPYVPNMDQAGFVGPESQEGYIDQYGFGIVELFLREQQMSQEDTEAKMAKDPNDAIADALSDSERDAYYAALYGPPPDIDHESMTEDEIEEIHSTLEPSGCRATAHEEVWDDKANEAFIEQFGTLLTEVFRSVESDPRVRELEETWSACMADSGYDFTNETDIQDFILRRLEEVGVIDEIIAFPEGLSFGFKDVEIEPGGPIEAALNEIEAEEIALAKVSQACSAAADQLRQKLHREAEQRFIQEHLAELEQFKKDHS